MQFSLLQRKGSHKRQREVCLTGLLSAAALLVWKQKVADVQIKFSKAPYGFQLSPVRSEFPWASSGSLGSLSGASCALRERCTHGRAHLCAAGRLGCKAHALCASCREQCFLKTIWSGRARSRYVHQISLYYHTLEKDQRDWLQLSARGAESLDHSIQSRKGAALPSLILALRYYQALFGVCNNQLAETEGKKKLKHSEGYFILKQMCFSKEIS